MAQSQSLASPKPTPQPATAASQPATSDSQPATSDSRIEHLRVEDASTRIDEQRVGGESQHITVQPKGGMPSYQVAPKTGERTWKVLGF
ncbi:hypothetical protein [Rhodoferax sp.]|uniref:hypothetical protein n=1 Tax=Rhodoferax sp. TaxID=50421 RepID=UPI00261188BB|nr:hypothetical protein [Rhodoferax sp.]MDD4943407.1 hypothetical protein [Rhodoferax sp.]MDD5478294.1 hypothetical protein [Rhodoferax sp.]